MGGTGDFEGRLEILHNEQWGTVCNDAWDFTDARVVCQQLGYEDVLEANVEITRFGEGTGPIWLDEVSCTGDEKRLVDCGRATWGDNDCNHSEDIGIVCVTGGFAVIFLSTEVLFFVNRQRNEHQNSVFYIFKLY